MIEHYPESQNSRARETAALLSRMSVAMDAYPPAFLGNALNLLFLDDALPIRYASAYLRGLDSPNLCDVCREYLMPEEHALWPFPVHSITDRPDLRIPEQPGHHSGAKRPPFRGKPATPGVR